MKHLVHPPVCGFCEQVVVLGEIAQSIEFESGVIVSIVHAWRCKESLYQGR